MKFAPGDTKTQWLAISLEGGSSASVSRLRQLRSSTLKPNPLRRSPRLRKRHEMTGAGSALPHATYMTIPGAGSALPHATYPALRWLLAILLAGKGHCRHACGFGESHVTDPQELRRRTPRFGGGGLDSRGCAESLCDISEGGLFSFAYLHAPEAEEPTCG